MKTLNPAVLAARNARQGVSVALLFWISAKNRTTNAIETIGFWTGADHQQFTINSQSRTYYGAGNLIEINNITNNTGLEVKLIDVSLNAVSPEVEIAFRGYETKFAPVEVHRAEFSTETSLLLAEPERVFRGWIDSSEINIPAIGDEGAIITATLASNSRSLTRTLPHKYSDTSQKAAYPSDDFFKNVSVTDIVDIYWGEKKASAQPISASPSVESKRNRGTVLEDSRR